MPLTTSPTVLIVDDEAEIRDLVTANLEPDGYRIRTAGSAADALDVLLNENVDVVISDQMLLGMTGQNLLSRVAQQFPHTVRIMLSAQINDELIANFDEGVAHHFIAKPWNRHQLRNVVQTSLNGRQAEPASQ